jgi:hypothetical protein
LQGTIGSSPARSVSAGWISAAASCGALIVSLLQYRLAVSKERQQRNSSATGSIIIDPGQR